MPLRQFRARARGPAICELWSMESASSTIGGLAHQPASLRRLQRRLDQRRNAGKADAAGRGIRATAISFAALSTVGAPPPASSARRASPSAGKRSRSGFSNVERADLAPGRAAAPARRCAPATRGNARSGCACRASRAARSPSRRGTRPGHGRSIADAPARRSRPAAAQTDDAPRSASRPLFISVAESIVTFGPMDQFGCLSACSSVALRICSVRPGAERPARRRHDDPVTSSRRPGAERLKHARCARNRPAARSRRLGGATHEQRACANQTFLVGERDASRRARPPPASARAGRAGDRRHHPFGRALRRFDDCGRAGGRLDPEPESSAFSSA